MHQRGTGGTGRPIPHAIPWPRGSLCPLMFASSTSARVVVSTLGASRLRTEARRRAARAPLSSPIDFVTCSPARHCLCTSGLPSGRSARSSSGNRAMLAAIRRASSLGGINLYSRRTSGDFRMALPMDLLHFSDCSLMECCIRLHQHVILVNINCVDLGIVTYQNAAAQSKKERC